MEHHEIATEQFREALDVHTVMAQSTEIATRLAEWANTCAKGLENGGIIFFAGNGGSFADAQHMAAELTGKMGRMRRSLAGIALGANNSSISAIGNDFGYEFSFARELEGLHNRNSVVIAFSTSGNSKNLIELAKAAKKLKLPMLCLTGVKQGLISDYCETISLPSQRTERIQELQTLFGHTLCLIVEESMGLSKEPYSR